MILYDPLWRTMREKKISQYRLIRYFGFSPAQIGRLKRNQYVSTHTIGVLCTILNCSVEEVMEFRMDNSEYAFPASNAHETAKPKNIPKKHQERQWKKPPTVRKKRT